MKLTLSIVCVKDDFLSAKIQNDSTFSVIKLRTGKRYNGTSNLEIVLINCCPHIRKLIMKDIDGYAYVGLLR